MVALYIIVFLIWTLKNYFKFKFNISTYILLFYLFGMLSCGIIFIYYPQTIQYPERLSVFSIGYHIVFLVLLLFPLVVFGDNLRLNNIDISSKQIRKLSWWIIAPSFVSIIISLSTIFLLFSLQNFHSARQLFLDGSLEGSFVSKLGPIGYFISLGKCCSSIALVLGIFNLFKNRDKSLTTYLLLISSLAYPIFTLSFAGRDGILRWVQFLIFSLILTNKSLSYKRFKFFWWTLFILFVSGIIVLTTITSDRFSESDNGVLYSLFRYIGEPYYIFSYGYERFGYNPMSDTIFSPFPIITQEKPELLDLNSQFSASYYLNTFHTIVGDFMIRTGILKGAILMSLISIILTTIFGLKSSHCKISFPLFTGFIFYYEIMLTGAFYYMHNDRFIQFAIVFYILLSAIYGRKTLFPKFRHRISSKIL